MIKHQFQFTCSLTGVLEVDKQVWEDMSSPEWQSTFYEFYEDEERIAYLVRLLFRSQQPINKLDGHCGQDVDDVQLTEHTIQFGDFEIEHYQETD